MQCVLQGRLPISMINPAFLRDLLRNVSLHLPSNYELAGGIKLEVMHLYYDLIKVAMIGYRPTMRLVLSVPLMTAEQRFSIYKVIVWPTRILKDKFIKYKLDFDYF